jgi:hypothetical protein
VELLLAAYYPINDISVATPNIKVPNENLGETQYTGAKNTRLFQII